MRNFPTAMQDSVFLLPSGYNSNVPPPGKSVVRVGFDIHVSKFKIT